MVDDNLDTSESSDATKDIDLEVLFFRVVGTYLCVELNAVEKVVPLVALKPVPMGANYVVGMMNIEGDNFPVIDLSSRLHIKDETHFGLDTPIIVFRKKDKRVGVIVSEVIGVDLVLGQNIQNEAMHVEGELVYQGVAQFQRNNTSAFLVEPNWLLNISVYGEGVEEISRTNQQVETA